jgi:hypothetical protein
MFAPPPVIETEVFARLPNKFRRKDPDNAWAIVNRRGIPVDSLRGLLSIETAIFTSSTFRMAGYSVFRRQANSNFWPSMTASPTG